MVELRPFKKLRYKLAKIADITKVVCLPYDIITPIKQEEFYRLSPYNFVRLVLPKDEPGDGADGKYQRVKKLMDEWIRDGILVEDDKEALYLYEEDYPLEGKRLTQAGIIGLVKLEPFEKGIILPHERILKGPLEDRYRLLKATNASLEMIIGLFPDKADTAAKAMAKYMALKPQLDFIHADDIRHRVWKITDKADIEALARTLKGNNIIIADGHHRYTTALKVMEEGGPTHLLMLLQRMENGLKVLPTHRLLKNIPEKEKTLKKLTQAFELTTVEGGLDELLAKMATEGKPSFGLYNGSYHLLTLKDAKALESVRDPERTKAWNELDVNVLQSLIITKLLGVDYKAAADNGSLGFVKDAKKAVKSVYTGEYEAAFLLNPTSIDEIYAVAKAGERMPQKSTYFYPKPLSGILMARL
ncbi:MAG: DUF1015 domain-containing protein [Candidatus Altiarchaeota archaeon]